MLTTTASAADAQSWPARPVTVVSPFTAGNASDLIGRITLEQVSRQVGQPFVIENRPGAGGTVGVNQVAKADPDGYTILMHSSSFSAALVLHKSLPYDTLQDFAPVIPIGNPAGRADYRALERLQDRRRPLRQRRRPIPAR